MIYAPHTRDHLVTHSLTYMSHIGSVYMATWQHISLYFLVMTHDTRHNI
jgi:hypothetical protein